MIREEPDQREEDTVAELPKGRRITGGERDKLSADLRRRYENGDSIRTLAAETGRSYGFIHRVLSESGATLRGRGGATRRKSAPAAPSPAVPPAPPMPPTD